MNTLELPKPASPSKSKKKKKLEAPAPVSTRLLKMEIESFHRKIAYLLMKGDTIEARAEVDVCRAEVVLRVDQYRVSSGMMYEKISDVNRTDKNALIRIYGDLLGHSWKNKFGWIGQAKTAIKPEIAMFDAEAVLFDGISCSQSTVTGIELTNNGCEGVLSDKIGDLQNLTTIYLDSNNLFGKIPHGLGRLEKLEFLNLAGNNLEGRLDDRCITKLTTLRILDLSFNDMGGELPDCFDNITKLQDLNLAGNHFCGRLPNTMASLVNLRNLKLYSNDFNGDLPMWLGGMTNLLTLNLSKNRFSGEINQIFTCTKLKRIILCNNHLSGPLSESLSNLECLEVLYINDNMFTGPLPESIVNLQFLRLLNLSDNEFDGRLPEDFGNLHQLRICTLSNTRLQGPLPPSVSKLVHLRDFHIFTSSKSESMSLVRGFTKNRFNRVYCWGTSVGIDNVSWQLPTMDDIGNVFAPKPEVKKKSSEDGYNDDEDSR